MDGDLRRFEREASAITDRYARRNASVATALYDPLNPSVFMSTQERERALIRLFRRLGRQPESMTVLEMGCGAGGNLAELIKFGFAPQNLSGLDLLKERLVSARRRLPSDVTLIQGDALTAALPSADYDVLYVSTVFSSILDGEFQDLLARRMWSLVKPGGFVLWYDFVYDNPKNPDVKGVTLRRIGKLFPQGTLRSQRVTLAPPISRLVTRVHPELYTLLNAFPFLRTHVLCHIKKAIA
jgi:ubiquinone/menaquinone biosynthesis C-methylase UbiE